MQKNVKLFFIFKYFYAQKVSFIFLPLANKNFRQMLKFHNSLLFY